MSRKKPPDQRATRPKKLYPATELELAEIQLLLRKRDGKSVAACEIIAQLVTGALEQLRKGAA